MAAETARDLKLGPGGDLVVESGDLVLVRGADAIVQSVRSRLQFFKGEWYLALDAGMPYYQAVLVKNPNVSVLQSIFRKEIAETPGISSVDSLTLTFDRVARRLSVIYTATADVGQISDTVVI